MLKQFLLFFTTLISKLSVGILLIALMLLIFALLWTGVVYIANERGDNKETTNIEQVQEPNTHILPYKI